MMDNSIISMASIKKQENNIGIPVQTSLTDADFFRKYATDVGWSVGWKNSK